MAGLVQFAPEHKVILLGRAGQELPTSLLGVAAKVKVRKVDGPIYPKSLRLWYLSG